MISEYLLPNESRETEARLTGFEAIYDGWSKAQLANVGVTEGWKCLEVGGGSGSIARWLAERVGTAGQVVVTDLDPRMLQGLASHNLEVRRHDIVRDELEADTFDLIHARMVLTHLREREQVIGRLVQALRPGGWLVLEDSDMKYMAVLDSTTADAQTLIEKVSWAATEALRKGGFDPDWGSRQYAALRRGGLVDVAAAGHVTTCDADSPGTELFRASYRLLRDQMIDTGVITSAELDAWYAATTEPSFAWFSPLLISTRGRRPATAA
ncbi:MULTISPECIES: class I SAM-dependent methyltransferase [unclassified Streptomyces]|uniref:class I SAM-dependent methyltransferase n=1 Tax=unclassified Streptomyces TaxID=2593676 RepID=UPI00380EF7C3